MQKRKKTEFEICVCETDRESVCVCVCGGGGGGGLLPNVHFPALYVLSSRRQYVCGPCVRAVRRCCWTCC